MFTQIRKWAAVVLEAIVRRFHLERCSPKLCSLASETSFLKIHLSPALRSAAICRSNIAESLIGTLSV